MVPLTGEGRCLGRILEHGKFELSVFIVYLSGFLSRLVEIICVCIYMYAGESVVCSVVSDSATPWTIARQAPLSLGFSRQEYWSGLPFPSPRDFPKLRE